MTVNPPPAGKKDRYAGLNIVVSALALFLITGYAPFAIAALLSDRMHGVPVGFIVSAVFFSMALGTMLSCIFTRTSLIVGPAVGLASFVSQTSTKTISVGQFILAGLVAACVALVLSRVKSKLERQSQNNSASGNANQDENRLSLRQEFLDSIPEPVKMGVRGGIGALLAAAAIHGLQDVANEFPKQYSLTLHLFVLGTAALLAMEVLLEKLEKTPKNYDLTVILLRLASALLPLLLLALLLWNGAFHLPAIKLEWQLPSSYQLINPFNFVGADGTVVSNGLIILCFSLVILFVFLIDIPGSPYDFLKKRGSTPKEVEETIDRSFLVTSGMSIVNPFLGLYTSVYYAENHAIVRDDKVIVSNSATGWVCSVLFFLLAVAFLRADLRVGELKLWFLIALAPSLFTIGVRMTARALKLDSEEEKVPSYYFLPAALTLLLTHFIGFEIALPIGVVYYGVYRWAAGDDKAVKTRTEAENRAEDWFRSLLSGSVFIVIVLGAIRLGYG